MKSRKRPHRSASVDDHKKHADLEEANFDANALPSDILYKIFRYLPAKTIPKVRTVCRRWNELIVANANKLPKIYIKKICFLSLSPELVRVRVESESHKRYVELSYNWLFNAASKFRPCFQLLLRHIVITLCFAFYNCGTLGESTLDELCECGTSFGEKAGVALQGVDLPKMTSNFLTRFLSAANSLFHFVQMEIVTVEETFVTDSSLFAITGGKLERFIYNGYSMNRQGNKDNLMKHVTGRALRHFAGLSTPLSDIMLAPSNRIRPADVVDFVDIWQKNTHARKLSSLTLFNSSTINYTTLQEQLLKSTFKIQYMPRDRTFSIKHPTLLDHILEIGFLS